MTGGELVAFPLMIASTALISGVGAVEMRFVSQAKKARARRSLTT